MDLNNAYAFYKVVELQHFSKAAEALFISQSAVSHRIKKLEQELSVDLINRLSSQFELTKAGERLFAVLNETMGKIIQVERDMEQLNAEESQSIKIGVAIASGETVLEEQIEAVYQEFSHVEIVTGTTIDLFEKLKIHDIDVIISASKRLDDFVELSAEIIRKTAYCLVANSKVKDKTDLSAMPFLTNVFDGEEKYRDKLESLGINFSKISVIQFSLNLIKKLIHLNVGFAILSEESVKREMESGIFQVIETLENLDIKLLYLKEHAYKKKIKKFKSIFRYE